MSVSQSVTFQEVKLSRWCW